MTDNFLSYDPVNDLNKSNKKTKGKIKNLSRLKFDSIKERKPIFSYRYVKLEETKYCFNNPNIDLKDIFELFKVKKQLCSLTFDQIRPTKEFHFHELKLNKRRYSKLKEELNTIIKAEATTDAYDIPELYQFAIYTNKKIDIEKSPRVFGFLGQNGIFYVIWLDLHHDIISKRGVEYGTKTKRKK